MPELSDFQQSDSLLWNVLQYILYLLSHWGDFVWFSHQTGKCRMCSPAAIQIGTELYTQHASRDSIVRKKKKSHSNALGVNSPFSSVGNLEWELQRTGPFLLQSHSFPHHPPSDLWAGQYPASGFWSKALAFFFTLILNLKMSFSY